METDLTTLEKVRTRQRLSPDERIPQILDAALAEFTRCGFAAARMDDIAARCGLSKGGLYAHFGAKEALFDALAAAGIARDDHGFILTGPDLKDVCGWNLDRPPHHLETSVPGVFVAGDVRAESAKRVAAAVGEGSMAVMLVHRYLAET